MRARRSKFGVRDRRTNHAPALAVRPTSLGDDQERTATPKVALLSGADFLVIGRPITGAENPEAAAAEIFASLN